MPYVDEMTPAERSIYDRWVALGCPNPTLLMTRRIKAYARHRLLEGVPASEIRERAETLLRRSCASPAGGGGDSFAILLREQDKVLAEVFAENGVEG